MEVRLSLEVANANIRRLWHGICLYCYAQGGVKLQKTTIKIQRHS